MENRHRPLISIITATFNSEKHFLRTVNSVRAQNYSAIEYIVVDGGSTDNTLKLIESNNDVISKWKSEPDNGIADAMNKGYLLSTGEYILYIHSDDYLHSSNSIEDAMKHFDVDHEIFVFDVLYGSVSNNRILKARNFNFWTNFKGPHHQGIICNRSVFNKIGTFNTKYAITMDYDFFLRAYQQNIKLKRCNQLLSFMGDDGVSSLNPWPRLKEERDVHLSNCKNLFMRIIYLVYWPLYTIFRKFKR